MKRKFVLAVPITGLLAATLAEAQSFNTAVLYPLNLPSGFTYGGPGGYPQTAAEGQVVGSGNNGADQALLWSGSSGTPANLNPTNLTGITSSYINGTNGTQQVGYGFGSGTSNNSNALLWNGVANTVINLNPTNLTGVTNSFAYSTNGTQQVGFGYGTGTSNNDQALLWTGSASTAVNLNPTNISGISNSFANNTDGTQQVGYGYGSATSNNAHALLWSGSASTAVDLNPTNLTGITTSTANAVSGTQEVGYGLGSGTGGTDQALLWTGSAASAINLNPTDISGITSSTANSTNGSEQVGYGFGSGTGDNTHALLWNGTASSAVDLQLLLPSSENWIFSEAYTIDSSGDVFGVAYGTYNGTANSYAVEWTPVSTQLTWDNSGGASPSDGQTWDVNNNNNWNNGTAATVYSNGSQVTFNDSNSGNYAVTLNTTVNPFSVTVNNSLGNYTISGTGTIVTTGAFTKTGTSNLTLGVGLVTPDVVISAGTIALAPGVAGGSGPANTSAITVGALNISGSGQLDITNNHMIVKYGANPDPIASIAAMIASGYNGGAWNGPGVVSSTAAANANYGIGYADSADPGNPAALSSGTIEIAYTLLGDANLDGIVNGIDFGILAANFNKGVSGWDQGDFNYDNVVNGIDFGELAANFNKGATGASVGLPAYDDPAILAFASANGLLADVPEPATIGLFLMASAGILARRRRRY
jgi:hypothetical protein